MTKDINGRTIGGALASYLLVLECPSRWAFKNRAGFIFDGGSKSGVHATT